MLPETLVYPTLVVGLLLLASSLRPAWRLHERAREHARAWGLIVLLIPGFALGYLAFLALLIQGIVEPTDLLAALLFLLGAIFVRVIVHLTEDAFREMQRVTALQVHAASHDELTGLWNRSWFIRKAGELLGRLPETGREQAALAVMDLSQFRMINQTLGHYHGDLILREVGRRLRRAVGDHQLIGRVGGDKFAVLIERHNSPRRIRLMLENIADSLRAPYELDEHQQVDLGVHIGVATSPEHGRDADQLLRRAELAILACKNEGREVKYFDPAFDLRDKTRLTLLADLKSAIASGELVLQYQPQVEMNTGSVCSAEALVRWPHPRLGLLGPDEFIGLAEEAGLINALTYWVLRESFRQLAEWKREGLKLRLGINLSVGNLLNQDFYRFVTEQRTAHGVRPEQVKFEITESAVMEDPQRAMEILTRMHGEGYVFSIDDFGTGYSSLSYLKRLPVDEIKIDKSFVMEMTRDDNDAVIVRSTIDLAHNMGRRVVAEGVESQDALEVLKILGCDCVQGFHLARPMAADVLRHWVVSSAFRIEHLVNPGPASRVDGEGHQHA